MVAFTISVIFDLGLSSVSIHTAADCSPDRSPHDAATGICKMSFGAILVFCGMSVDVHPQLVVFLIIFTSRLLTFFSLKTWCNEFASTGDTPLKCVGESQEQSKRDILWQKLSAKLSGPR